MIKKAIHSLPPMWRISLVLVAIAVVMSIIWAVFGVWLKQPELASMMLVVVSLGMVVIFTIWSIEE